MLARQTVLPGPSQPPDAAAAGRVAQNGAMRIGRRPRELERTCAGCGYACRVPRSATRRGISAFSMAPRLGRGSDGRGSGGWSDSEPEIAASMAVAEVAEAYRRCPERGPERYTQQPIRR
jgi:hypothetical protein